MTRYISCLSTEHIESQTTFESEIEETAVEQEIEETKTEANTDCQLKVSADLYRLLIYEKFSDVKITLNNSTIHAHKAILSARCSLFAAMFESETAENSTNEVKITDIRDEVFQELLRFLYSGTVKDIDVSHELLLAADKYALEDLKSLCGPRVSRNLSVDNAIEMLIMADELKVENLKFSAIGFINKNATEIIKTDGYKSLVKSHLNLIAELYEQKCCAESEKVWVPIDNTFAKTKLKVSADLRKIFNKQHFSDVKIVLKKSTLHAHKAILSARCPVFSAMFDHEMIENSTNEVTITDIEDKVFRELLRFIYTGTVNDIEKVSADLLAAADKYALEDLKTLCGSSLSENLTVDNAAEILILAEKFTARNLNLSAMKFINRNATKVIQTEGYTFLRKCHVYLVDKLYRHRYIS